MMAGPAHVNMAKEKMAMMDATYLKLHRTAINGERGVGV